VLLQPRMPTTANPNPDRARRGAGAGAPAAAAVVTTLQTASPAAPSAGATATVVPAVRVPPPAAATAQLAPVFGHAAVRATGLEQSSASRKRHAVVQRVEVCWSCVEITDEEDAHQPRWRCLGCGEFKSGGANRISSHLLGANGSKKCSGALGDEAFKANLQKVKKAAADKEVKKRIKSDVRLVNAAAAGEGTSSGAVLPRPAGQQGLNFALNHVEACDTAIAELFYACNISAAVADHPKFKKLVTVLKSAPASYKPPDRNKLHGPLLDGTVSSLQHRLSPLVEATLRDCATMLSDGWDTVQHDHLINFLYGNASCMFFDGTIELNSEDHESAAFMGELFKQRMMKIGVFAFIHVCTDTCSVMQANLPPSLPALPPSVPCLVHPSSFHYPSSTLPSCTGGVGAPPESVPVAHGERLWDSRDLAGAEGHGQDPGSGDCHLEDGHGALALLGPQALAAPQAARGHPCEPWARVRSVPSESDTLRRCDAASLSLSPPPI